MIAQTGASITLCRFVPNRKGASFALASPLFTKIKRTGDPLTDVGPNLSNS